VSNVPKSTHFRTAIIAVAAALALGGLVRANVIRLPGRTMAKAEKIPLKIAGRVEPVSLAQLKNGFSAAIVPDLPAVVNISTTKVIKRSSEAPDIFSDPFFRQFFGNQGPFGGSQPQTQREHSLGSGVIVNPSGYILTNNHVVSGASDVQVFTQDKKQYKAKVIGTDPRTDIAVLKIDATNLPTVTLGDSSELKVGDIVFAIGDPLGVGETATMGIVSAMGRSLGGTIEHYEDFIQTDAAINPGNSGGALVEIHGNLIGINTAILSSGGGGNEGIGFAIPINMARNVMDQILEHGKVIRGYLGVSIQQVNPDMAKAFGLSQGGGALISDVKPDSPAAKAGLERGDIVLEMNGQAVNGPDDLSVRVSQTAPGTVVHLKVFRDGKTLDVAVTPGEFPEETAAASPGGGGSAGASLQGLDVQNLTPPIARQLGLPATVSGVVVSGVDPSSPAAAAGIQQGDVIMEVNRKPVHNVTQYQQAVAGNGNRSILLLINRGGESHYVVVQPE
jgi:serine protease Do